MDTFSIVGLIAIAAIIVVGGFYILRPEKK